MRVRVRVFLGRSSKIITQLGVDRMGKLDGRVAVVTGGASGIGAATVRLFVEEGASVLAADIQDDKGRRLDEELGSHVRYLHADVSREEDVEAVIDRALEEFGRLDCLFNNAGIAGVSGSIESMPVEKFDEIIGVLLRGVFLGMKHAAPVMKQQGSGSIINNASIAGLRTGYANHIYSEGGGHPTDSFCCDGTGREWGPRELCMSGVHRYAFDRESQGTIHRSSRRKDRGDRGFF